MPANTAPTAAAYDVILINSGTGYAALCPGISGAVSQGDDRADALAMIADAMAMCLAHPLTGDDTDARRAELREMGQTRIAELAQDCRSEGREYEICQAMPQQRRAPV